MSDKDDSLTPEELAEKFTVSRSFIRLILDAGAPQTDGRATMPDVIDWVTANYNKVRALAGMPELPPIPEGIAPLDAAQIKIRNYLLTVLEYQADRAQDPELKAAMHEQARRFRGEEFPPAE